MAGECGFKALGPVTNVKGENCSDSDGAGVRPSSPNTSNGTTKQVEQKQGGHGTNPSTGQDRGRMIASSQPSKEKLFVLFS